jgi:hypothetical protein
MPKDRLGPQAVAPPTLGVPASQPEAAPTRRLEAVEALGRAASAGAGAQAAHTAHRASQRSHAVITYSSGKPGDGCRAVRAADQDPLARDGTLPRYRRWNPRPGSLFNTGVLLEIVEVELAQLNRVVSPVPNPVLHHELGQLIAPDQDQPLRDAPGIGLRGRRELAGSDEVRPWSPHAPRETPRTREPCRHPRCSPERTAWPEGRRCLTPGRPH